MSYLGVDSISFHNTIGFGHRGKLGCYRWQLHDSLSPDISWPIYDLLSMELGIILLLNNGDLVKGDLVDE